MRINHYSSGSTTTIVSQPTTTVTGPARRTAAKAIAPAHAGCIGQMLPLAVDKKASMMYPISLHAFRDLPWTVEFGKTVILRSVDCRQNTQQSGICTPCAKLLRNPIIKGILERNDRGS
jgi:hypothetical protein